MRLHVSSKKDICMRIREIFVIRNEGEEFFFLPALYYYWFRTVTPALSVPSYKSPHPPTPLQWCLVLTSSRSSRAWDWVSISAFASRVLPGLATAFPGLGPSLNNKEVILAWQSDEHMRAGKVGYYSGSVKFLSSCFIYFLNHLLDAAHSLDEISSERDRGPFAG